MNSKKLDEPIVQTFWKQVELIEISKECESNGLCSGSHWVNERALIALGILVCDGTYAQKANIFYRLVTPKSEWQISATDKNLRLLLFFMINTACIVNQLSHGSEGEEISAFWTPEDVDIYQAFTEDLSIVFNAIIDEFFRDIFQDDGNTVTREQFQERLTEKAFKYFKP